MKKKNLIAIFILCFAVTAGAVMPHIVLSYQDKRFESHKEKYEMERISFITDNTLFDALKLMGEETKSYETKDENAKHTRKEIYASALNTIKAFNEYMDLIDTNRIYAHKETAMYCVDGTKVAVSSATDSTDVVYDKKDTSIISVRQVLIWQCTMMMENQGKIEMYMDDSTGKMVSMYIYFDEIVQKQGGTIKYFKESDKIMQKFCSSYYGVQTEIQRRDKKNHTEVDIIMIDDASGEKVGTKLFMDAWSLNFNPCN